MQPERKAVIAIVAHGVHDQGGMERALFELIRRAADRYSFVVISCELDEQLRPLVRWERISVPRRPIPLKMVLFAIAAGRRLRRVEADLVHTMGAVVPNKVDVVNVQFCTADLVAATGSLASAGAPRLRRVNTALTRALTLRMERWCYRPSRLRVLTPVSAGLAHELARHFPGVTVTVTPNGVDNERYRPNAAGREAVRAESDVAERDVVALFVGGDWDRKGLETAIRGVGIAAASGVPLQLWIVGRGDEKRFRSIAAEAGAQVSFFGPRAETAPFFQGADVFVLPTLYETFSLVAHEAAASGLPIVATATHGIAELVGDDEAGVLVDRDAQSVADALSRLALDDALRARLGAEARSRAGAYGWDRSVESMVDVYERLRSAT